MVRPSLKKMGGVEHTASIVRTRKISTYLQSLPKIPPKEMHQAKHTPQFSPSGTQKEEKDRFSPRIYLHQLQCHSYSYFYFWACQCLGLFLGIISTSFTNNHHHYKTGTMASPTSSLISLPDEVQVHILSFLQSFDLGPVVETCRFYHDPQRIHQYVIFIIFMLIAG